MRRLLFALSAILALVLMQTTELHAQWKRLWTFPVNVRAVYFLDNQNSPQTGFAGMYNGTIYRTKDNGASWSLVSTPVVQPLTTITSINFKDSLQGWCSVSTSLSNADGIWTTTDGGANWSPITLQSSMVSVAYSSYTGMLFATNWSGQGFQSTNLGLNWTTFTPQWQDGIAFSGKYGVISNLRAPSFLYTSDGGVNWQQTNPILATECWSPMALAGSDTFFAVSERIGIVYESTNGGASWSNIFGFGTGSTQPHGCISGTRAGLFVQTFAGFFSSTDLGRSWLSICGPMNASDTRFYTRGKEIFSGDNQQNLWYNPDGTAGVTRKITYDLKDMVLAATRCRSADSIYHFGYPGSCSATLIIARLVSGAPAFQLATGLLPRSLGSRDSVHVTYTPQTSGRDSGTLELQFDVGGVIVDTLIPLIGNSTESGKFTMSPMLAMVQKVACSSQDSLVVIRNLGCDTLAVTSALLLDSTYFQLPPPLVIPRKIAPNDSMVIHVRSGAKSDGRFATSLKLHMQEGALIGVDTTIPLLLNVLQSGRPTLTTLDLALLNRCVELDTVYEITNPRCDTVTLTAVSLDDTTHFTLTGMQLPAVVPPGAVLRIPMHVGSGAKGTYVTAIRVTYRTGAQTIDTFATLLLQVKTEIPVRAQLDRSILRFGALNVPCDSGSGSFVLRNTLCRDLRVVRVVWIKTDSQYYFDPPDLPHTLVHGADDSIVIPMHFHPAVLGSQSLQLRITLDVDGVERDTVVTVQGTGVSRFSAIVVTPVLTYGTLSQCATGDRIARVVNTTCHSVTATSAAFGNGAGYTIVSPTFPRDLAPFDTLSVLVRFTPSAVGPQPDVLIVKLRDFGVEYPESVDLTVDVTPAAVGCSIAPVSFNVASPRPCQPVDSAIVIRNLADCEDLIVTDYSAPGYPALSLDKSVALPFTVKPGDSAKLKFTVTPDPDSGTTVYLHVKGTRIDTTIAVVCAASIGARVVSVNAQDSIFNTRPCRPLSKSYSISNDGCQSLTIDDVSLLGAAGQSQFLLDPKPVLPIVLAPGEHFDFVSSYDPNGSGDNTATLRIESKHASYLRIIPFRAAVKGSVPSARVQLQAADGSKSILRKPDTTAEASLIFMDDVGDSVGLSSASFTLNYDQDLLSLATLNTGAGWAVIDTVSEAFGKLAVRVRRNAIANITSGSAIVNAIFKTAVAPHTTSDIALSDLQFNFDDPTYEQCGLASLSMPEPVHFTMSDECGDALLREAMSGKLDVTLGSVQPNPVTLSDGAARITLGLSASQSGSVRICITDVLGKRAFDREVSIIRGTQTIPVIVEHATEGMYYVTVESQGARHTRRVMIGSR